MYTRRRLQNMASDSPCLRKHVPLLNHKPPGGIKIMHQGYNRRDTNWTYVVQAASAYLNIRGMISWIVMSNGSALLHA
jgi:hypothetical protein